MLRDSQRAILIGHKGHQELIGTAGYVPPEKRYIIENEDDIESQFVDLTEDEYKNFDESEIDFNQNVYRTLLYANLQIRFGYTKQSHIHCATHRKPCKYGSAY